MYGGDRSRGENMASGFLLRWITVRWEFETMQNQVIYVSATPADCKKQSVVVEQNPSYGLLDVMKSVQA
jgi:excinuclease UvrABC helicase subunit UvrB